MYWFTIWFFILLGIAFTSAGEDRNSKIFGLVIIAMAALNVYGR